MNVKPTQILRLLLQDHNILIQLGEMSIRTGECNDCTKEAIKDLCDRIDWSIKFIRSQNGFTYEDITTDPDNLPTILTMMEVSTKSTREVILK